MRLVFFLFAIALVSIAGNVESFYPSKYLLIVGKNSHTHASITKAGISEVCKRFFFNQPGGREVINLEKTYDLDSGELISSYYYNKTSIEQLSIVMNFLSAVATIVDYNKKTDVLFGGIPTHHFDSETFEGANRRLEEYERKIMQFIDQEDYLGARKLLGGFFHTLQDFYSHTNYVELGNTDILSALGSSQALTNLAKPNERTCKNSEPASDNMHYDNNVGAKLSSGYFAMPWEGNHKPAGKCSHGGRSDSTTDTDATGGINKDDTSAVHGYLHQQAAGLATEHSRNFLMKLYENKGDLHFAKLFNLEYEKTLAFVIDTTGSMSEEIEGVKQNAIDITRNQINSAANKPTEFVLVPFNDPGFGPLFKTKDPEQFIREIGKLYAHGGGDEPEMYFSGLILALQGCQPSSQIHIYTDASAKDKHRINEAIALIKEKQITVFPYLTSNSGRNNLKINNAGQFIRANENSDSRAFGLPEYDLVAQASGTQQIFISKRETGKLSSFISLSIEKTQVAYAEYSLSLNATKTFTTDLSIDEYVSGVSLVFSSKTSQFYSSVLNLTLISPSGSETQLVNLTTDLALIKVAEFTPKHLGIWRLRVAYSYALGLYLKVVFRTETLFSYKIAKLVQETAHAGLFELDRQPLVGETIVFTADSFISQKYSPNKHPVLERLVIVDALTFAERLSFEIGRDETNQYYSEELKLPDYLANDNQLKVIFIGQDSQGNRLQRVSSNTFQLQKALIDISVENETSLFSISPGSKITIQYKITNSGAKDNFFIRGSINSLDTVNVAQISMVDISRTITIDTNQTYISSLTISASKYAPLGLLFNVYISTNPVNSADKIGFSSTQIVVDLNPPDRSPPVCFAEKLIQCYDGLKALDNEFYELQANITDYESGLKSVIINTAMNASFYEYSLGVNSNSFFGPGDGQIVNFIMNCSLVNEKDVDDAVVILVSDKAGNSEKCSFRIAKKNSTASHQFNVALWVLTCILLNFIKRINY